MKKLIYMLFLTLGFNTFSFAEEQCGRLATLSTELTSYVIAVILNPNKIEWKINGFDENWGKTDLLIKTSTEKFDKINNGASIKVSGSPLEIIPCRSFNATESLFKF